MTDPSQPPAAPPRPRQFQLLFMCLLVIGGGNSMLLAIAPPLVREVGLADSSIGFIFSLSALLWSFTSAFWGRYSDRVGRKPMIAFGLTAYAASMIAFGGVVLLGQAGLLRGAGLFLALICARAIFGAFGSAASPSAQAYIADRTSIAERTQQLAALNSAFAMGQAFGPALCAALAAWLGLVFPIGLVAVLAAVSAFVVLRYLTENTPPKADRKRGGGRQELALLFDRRVSGHLLYGLSLAVVSGITVQIFGLFTMDRLNVEGELAAELTAAGFMVNALSVLVAQLALLPRLKLDPRGLMAWGAGLMTLGVAIQIFAPSLGALLVAQAVLGIGAGLARPGYVGGASIGVQPHEQGGVAGIVAAVNGAGFVLSPFLGGVVYERLGMDAPLILAAIMLAAMCLFALLSRRLRGRIIDEPPSADSPTP